MFYHKRFRASGAARMTAAVLAILTFAWSGGTTAERLLSLNEAIDIALGQGYSIKTLQMSLTQAEQNRLAAKYRFRSSGSLNLSTPSWTENVQQVPVPNGLPVYNSLGTLRYQGGFNINQPLPTDGSVSLRTNVYQSEESNFFAETDTSLKRKDFLTSLSVRLNQPLFTYNRLKYGLRRAELSYETSSLNYRRSQMDVVYAVTSTFFDLYRATRQRDIAREKLTQAEDTFTIARQKYEAGLIPEVDALRMEVDLEEARASRTEADASLEAQKDRFKREIGLDLSEDVGVETTIEYTHFVVDLDTALQEGLRNRYELREDEIGIEMQKMAVRETDARSEVTANLSAYYDFTGRSDPALGLNTGTYDLFDSSWNDLERRPGNHGVTFMVNIPVWDWGVNKAEVTGAEISLKRAQLQAEENRKSIETSIRDAVRSFETSSTNLEILQKRENIAQKTYDISVARFNNGDITSQALALDSNSLNAAKMAYLGAYISYRLAIEDLKRKCLYDFENNRRIE